MAQRVQVILEDDIDGGEASETITFGLDGVDYEIDLSDANSKKLRDALSTYIGAARRSGGRKKAAMAGNQKKHSPEDLAEMREWARSHGATVNDRGRLPQVIIDAFEAGDPSQLPVEAKDSKEEKSKDKDSSKSE